MFITLQREFHRHRRRFSVLPRSSSKKLPMTCSTCSGVVGCEISDNADGNEDWNKDNMDDNGFKFNTDLSFTTNKMITRIEYANCKESDKGKIASVVLLTSAVILVSVVYVAWVDLGLNIAEGVMENLKHAASLAADESNQNLQKSEIKNPKVRYDKTIYSEVLRNKWHHLSTKINKRMIMQSQQGFTMCQWKSRWPHAIKNLQWNNIRFSCSSRWSISLWCWWLIKERKCKQKTTIYQSGNSNVNEN